MPTVRRARRRSSNAKRWWPAAAIALALSVAAGVLIASSSKTPPTPAMQTSAWVRFTSGFGRGGNAMLSAPSQQRAAVHGTSAQLSQQERQRLSAPRETKQQFLASYKRQHTQQYKYYVSHKRALEQAYQALLKQWRRHHHGGKPAPAATPTTPPAASSSAPATAGQTTTPTAAPAGDNPTVTATPAATATTGPAGTATATPAATATAAPTATATAAPTTAPTATTAPTTTAPTTTAPATGITPATSPDWAGYAATGAAGTFTSVASNWIVPPVACGGSSSSSYAVGLDGDGTSTIEQIGTEGDCGGDFPLYSGWYQMAPNAPVFFKNPVKPGDAMTASVTALGGGNFMLTLFDMTQNWTQIIQQASTAATLGSAEIVAQDPVQNGQAQPLSNFGIVDFLGAAINNAPIAAPINGVTLVSAAGNTLAEPSNITGGAGNFAVGWDASA